jgi:hypothetical protein
MTRTLAFRHFQGTTVHLYTECPEGSIIGVARRTAIQDESLVNGLSLCEWCRARKDLEKE